MLCLYLTPKTAITGGKHPPEIFGTIDMSSARVAAGRFIKPVAVLPRSHSCERMRSPLAKQMCFAVDAFRDALCTERSSSQLLEFFSTSQEPVIQHTPANCSNPLGSRLTGLNAVRSYFDIQATHWRRDHIGVRGLPQLDLEQRTMVLDASVVWVWRCSRRRWTEDVNCTITLDDDMKIVSFVIRTESGPESCVWLAKDVDRPAHESLGVKRVGETRCSVRTYTFIVIRCC